MWCCGRPGSKRLRRRTVAWSVPDPGKKCDPWQQDHRSGRRIGKQHGPDRKTVKIQDHRNTGSAKHSDQYQAQCHPRLPAWRGIVYNPPWFYNLGVLGHIVEKLSVTEDLTKGHSGCVWQNLADVLSAFEIISAKSGSDVTRAPRQGRSGLRAQDRLTSGLSGPDAPHGGGRQKCKTAHDRVADHNGPDRQRQGQRHRDCAHSNHCGNQDQSCNHLTHPLCGSCGQGVGASWQDYVLELENLRCFLSPGPARIGVVPAASDAACIARAGDGEVRLQVEECGSSENAGTKWLAFQGKFPLAGPPAQSLSPGGAGWTGGRQAGAATCRKAKALSRQANPEVAEECLSFVIPGQQGGPGNWGEVH